LSDERVSLIQDTIALPTVGIGFDNPSTQFHETGSYAQGVSFPCAFHSHFLREEPVKKSYDRVALENEFLRVEFLPELGGRIWRIYDKKHGYDVVHTNDAIKPYPGGFGGAYCAGGIELNYPYAHSVTNCWPRQTDSRQRHDGSACYTVSEWERNGRTQWSITFTLSPGESRLRQTVSLYNPYMLPASFCYWCNAGVPADEDSKWVFREVQGKEHGIKGSFAWPEHKGLDLQWFKNDLEVIGIYFVEPRYNHFGVVNTRTKSGIAHYADWHEVPGKKLWTWGATPSGENRKWHLCLEPSAYGEIQSGRLIIQEHLEWLMPEQRLEWNEQWAPTFGLTDFSEVSEDCAFQVSPEDRALLYYPFTNIEGRRLVCELDGKPLREVDFSARTAEPGRIDLSDLSADQVARLQVTLLS
jgi:hypothetical protein